MIPKNMPWSIHLYKLETTLLLPPTTPPQLATTFICTSLFISKGTSLSSVIVYGKKLSQKKIKNKKKIKDGCP